MKKLFALLVSVLMLLSLCACGQSSSYTRDYAKTEAAAPMEAPMPEPAYYDNEEGYYGGLGLADSKAADSPEAAQPDLNPDKIIYSADATVETTEFEQTLERLQAMVAEYGGFIEASSISGNNYYNQSRGYGSSRSASYTIRIPAQHFQTLMSSLSTLGNVPHSHTYTDNISARYYDTEARLTAYQTQEQRLLEMMEKAETVSDLIEIESRLAELRYQIESIQSTLKNWDRQVSYSTVSLSINEVTVYTPEAKMSYGERLALALQTGLEDTGEFFADLLLWFLEALPALLILAALTVLVIVLIRRGSKKRRAKKAAQAAQLLQARQAAQAGPQPKE